MKNTHPNYSVIVEDIRSGYGTRTTTFADPNSGKNNLYDAIKVHYIDGEEVTRTHCKVMGPLPR